MENCENLKKMSFKGLEKRMAKESQEEMQMQMKGFFLGGKRLHVQELSRW